MRESMVLICPTEQAKVHAADWRDGQFAHRGCAGGGGHLSRGPPVIDWRVGTENRIGSFRSIWNDASPVLI